MIIKKALITSALAIPTFFGLASTANAYGDLSLVNAITDERVGSGIIYIRDYDLTTIGDQINFVYNHESPFSPNETETQSVHFIVSDSNGDIVADRVENQAPFSAFGDNNGDYAAYTATTGIFSIEARAYSEKFAQGNSTGGSVFLASFTRSVNRYGGLSIINADSNANVANLIVNGGTYSIADLGGSNLNLVADFGNQQDQVGSVVFDFFNDEDNEQNIENVAPFALYGDNNGDFNGQTFTPGTYTVRVRSFTESNGNGEELTSFHYIYSLTE